ncbi:MAG: hypothetical protein RL033_5284, partial [Pseudomonadota bacterium]
MSHLAKVLALSAALCCSGPKPAEPPAVPVAEFPATDPAVPDPAGIEPGQPTTEPATVPTTGPTEPATAPQTVTKTLFVAEALVACQGEAPQQCLRVRESEAEPYRNLHSGIAGFEYEPSYVYELRVEATTIPNPPADASAVRYRLL